MRSGLKALAALCSLAISVNTGCSGKPTSSGELTSESENTSIPIMDSTETADNSSAIYTVSEKDLTPATQSGSTISFMDSGAEVKGSGVSVSGKVVTITKAGTYSVSGSCSDGQLVIDCGKNDDVYLILNGVNLTCTDGPAILCENADKLMITLADATVNTISDGSGYTTESAEDTGAAIFSRETLVINGSGTLNVNGIYKDGIKSKDGLKLCGGNINVTAVEDGIIGKDYLLAAAGTLTVNSGYDGLKSTNSNDSQKGYVNITGGSYTLECGNDGIQAETSLLISGGVINIISGGGSSTVEHTQEQSDKFGKGKRDKFSTDGTKGFDFSDMTASDGTSVESMKGIKAGTSITVSGGEITADCADDTVHSNGEITIDGGTLTLSSGDDGIHADTVLTINDGEINISTSYEGLEGNGVEISGGTISLRAYDDGINASGSETADGSSPYITISGGSITANADGDGIDSNGTVSMSGGTLVVFGPTNGGNGALDYEKSFAMSGGTLIALGSRGMSQAPSTLSQPCLSIYGSVSADSTIEVRNSDDRVIISTVTPKQCESLIFSTSEFISGQTYSIYANDQLLSTVTATDGVSGGGATGSGFGNWNQDGGASWGGGMKPGRNDDDSFTRPEMPADGEMPSIPENGEMPTPPENNGGMPTPPENGEMPSPPDNNPDATVGMTA